MPNSNLQFPSASKKIEQDSSIVQWEPQPLPGGKAEEIVGRLASIDEGTNAGRLGGTTSNLGIQLRAIAQSGADADGKPLYEVIDTTRPFSWPASRRDEEGRLIEKGGVPTADAVASIVREYEQDLQRRLEGEPSISYSVEVMLFRQFVPASTKLHNKVSFSDTKGAQSGASEAHQGSPASGFGSALHQQCNSGAGLNADRDPSIIELPSWPRPPRA